MGDSLGRLFLRFAETVRQTHHMLNGEAASTEDITDTTDLDGPGWAATQIKTYTWRTSGGGVTSKLSLVEEYDGHVGERAIFLSARHQRGAQFVTWTWSSSSVVPPCETIPALLQTGQTSTLRLTTEGLDPVEHAACVATIRGAG
jgi:hypothetical protein